MYVMLCVIDHSNLVVLFKNHPLMMKITVHCIPELTLSGLRMKTDLFLSQNFRSKQQMQVAIVLGTRYPVSIMKHYYACSKYRNCHI